MPILQQQWIEDSLPAVDERTGQQLMFDTLQDATEPVRLFQNAQFNLNSLQFLFQNVHSHSWWFYALVL